MYPSTPVDPPCIHCDEPARRHVREAYASALKLRCPGLKTEYRRPDSAMPRLGVAPHPDVPLGVYRHYKGGRYLVVGGVLDASGEHDPVAVLYCSLEHGGLCQRTVADFLKPVMSATGRLVGRFAPEAPAPGALEVPCGTTTPCQERSPSRPDPEWPSTDPGFRADEAGFSFAPPSPSATPSSSGGS